MATYEFACEFCGVAVEKDRKPKRLHCFDCRRRCYRMQQRCGAIVQRAIRDGIIPRVSTLSCVDCGKPACDYDHRDYTKPLEIEPTCRKCNLKRGQGKMPDDLLMQCPDKRCSRCGYDLWWRKVHDGGLCHGCWLHDYRKGLAA